MRPERVEDIVDLEGISKGTWGGVNKWEVWEEVGEVDRDGNITWILS